MTTATVSIAFAGDVREGLSRRDQKTLPARWFYDDLGSALFEAITLLPEYGLTRADIRLLEAHAPEIANRVFQGSPAVRVVELGSGGGKKTRAILSALAARDHGSIDYHPMDVSPAALDQCVRALSSIARVDPIEATYPDGIPCATDRRRAGERLLVLFLGSNIGNFDPPAARALLDELRGALKPGDALLLGVDLAKPRERLLAAYDDASGITAAFNRNVLARVNRVLSADFDLAKFAHEARYDEGNRRVEMHLRSLGDQVVTIRELDLVVTFRLGETIWTESSYKFAAEELPAMAERSGFCVEATWTDREWPFAESLWRAA